MIFVCVAFITLITDLGCISVAWGLVNLTNEVTFVQPVTSARAANRTQVSNSV